MSDFDERARRATDGLKRALENADLPVDDGERKTKRRIAKRTTAAGSIAAIALVAGVIGFLPSNDKNTPTVALNGHSGAYQLAGALQPFNACDDALGYFKQHATDFYTKSITGPTAFADDAMEGGKAVTASPPTPSAGRAEEQSAVAPTQDAAGGSNSAAHSTTNVAEKNVDEPDIVKTDGSRIVTVTNGTVHLLSANGGSPTIRAAFPDQMVRNVFLVADRLVIFKTSGYGISTLQYPSTSAVGEDSTVAVYDIADITRPRSIGDIQISGTVVDARMVGTQVRLVTRYTPDIKVSPEYTSRGALTDASIAKLKRAVSDSTLEQWMPTFTLHDASGKETDKGQLVACTDLGHPLAFAGISTTSLLTFDATGSWSSRHTAGVIAGSDNIYGTANSLYVTSRAWNDGTISDTTDIHAFTTATTGDVKYEGSGSVPGTVINQYSLSEYQGVLRVATTTNDHEGWIKRQSVTQGRVSVLKLQNGKLEQVGVVTGLGAKDNEFIQSVRFVGTRGYVTTFRQTDPFYVLDLSEATAPKIAGELKIPGFSSYLHPISDNLILGVGQSGSVVGPAMQDFLAGQTVPADGGVTAPAVPSIAPRVNGVEFSLFDVGDPTNPKKVSSKMYGSGSAGAQFDAKAFLYYEPMNLIVSPLTEYDYSKMSSDKSTGMWSGLVLLRPTENGLVEVGRLQNSDAQSFNVERTFIIENNVYQLSQGALQVNSLDTHKQIARVQL